SARTCRSSPSTRSLATARSTWATCSMPPTGSGAGRRALYVTFMPERAFDAIPPGRGYNDVIRARESLAR
ncbi:MAG TPA: hypothetical protein VKD46_03490, partial [bacterium]|nr:hypothetical protein [bacterium]